MLAPKKVKHRKVHRGRRRGLAKGGTEIHFGDYGLVALQPAWITNRQIEAARVAITRHIRRGGKVWINIFPDKPFTKKPAETRMGSGKGNPEGWVAVVKPGRGRSERQEVEEELARADAEALAQSRQAQAAGTKKGEPLDVMLEPGAEVAEADAEPEEQQAGKRTRRRRGSKKEASGND